MGVLFFGVEIFTVAIIHVVVGVLLYRNTINSRWCTAVAIYLPLVAAFATYSFLLWRLGFLSSTLKFRLIATLLLAAAAAIMSMLCMMTIAFNRYGS
jgi:hypothetical protein